MRIPKNERERFRFLFHCVSLNIKDKTILSKLFGISAGSISITSSKASINIKNPWKNF